MKTQNIKKKSLLRKYNTKEKEILYQVLKSLNNKCQQRCNDCLDTENDKASTIEPIVQNCKTARNSSRFSDRKILNNKKGIVRLT